MFLFVNTVSLSWAVFKIEL